MKTFTDLELLYATVARCDCGAGMAYPLASDEAMSRAAWECSDVLKGVAQGDKHSTLPFAFYKIREETSINNHDRVTTRPVGTLAMTVGHAVCGACKHEWGSEPYHAPGMTHHWFPGACPKCGNDCGANGSWSSDDKRPRIEVRYHDVVVQAEAAKDKP